MKTRKEYKKQFIVHHLIKKLFAIYNFYKSFYTKTQFIMKTFYTENILESKHFIIKPFYI